MCGFVGVYDCNKQMKYDINKMVRLIQHRGPDEQSIETIDNTFHLGFARLAIIDLNSGSQPMHSFDKNITVLCNGEIYNYKELRQKLISNGAVFYSASDVEVFLRMYEYYGINMLSQINGMYAAVIVDQRTNEVFLLRDRLGIKPLYYTCTESGRYAFASEIKCLMELPFVSNNIDKDAVAEFLSYEYIHGPRTIFSDIKKVLPGQYLRITENSFNHVTYWDCGSIETEEGMEIEDAKKGVIKYLQESMELHLRSDVPLGFFLSGGIDSGLLVALASKKIQDINTYTLKFENNQFDETGLAQLVAERYKTNHHCLTIKPNDFKRLILEMLWFFDEPLGDSGILPNYMLNQLVKKDGIKVILSGTGGDELFGGYSYYFENSKERMLNSISCISRIAARILKGRKNDISQKIERALSYKKSPFEHMLLCETVHKKFFVDNVLETGKNVENVKRKYYENCKASGLNKLLYTDIKTYLTDDLLLLLDRSGMAHSIEGRVPFLHHPLVEFAMKIPERVKTPNGERKWLLKEIAKEYLPSQLLSAPKMGFFSPIQRWEKSGLGELTYQVLNSDRSIERGIWNKNIYRNYIKNKEEYKNNYSHLYLFFILELYFRIHIDNNFANSGKIVSGDIYGK